MNAWQTALIVLISLCESAGIGLIGMVVLRLLRRYSLGVSLIAVVVITVLAMNTSLLTMMLATRSAQLPAGVDLLASCVAGAVSIGIGLMLGRSVMAGSARLASATREFGTAQQFRPPEDPPTAELAELARELRITSDKLAESRRREQTAEASRRRLVAWISHDLRSPLARMRAMTESVQDGVATDLPRYVAQIRADADRLAEMVDDLFELSRIQAGTLPLQPQRLALDDLISDVVAGQEVLAGQRNVTLRPARIDQVTVSVDERTMSRAFNNLLNNAMHYSPEGTTVSLDVRADGGWATVSVADECGGIPPENLGSVFDMGWRGNSARRSGNNKGGGLGLAIVQGVVQAHRGRVSVHNVPGGCCFQVQLPLVTA
ncbi:HAMP domain-containing sensor histidine kinase [Saccharopolyspora sp. SCSIO 74807]|uniref:sensor histidine kinase n=1 Tax=Saccharopolyspora sp. SCSIO 74807 TaxID=3118084 RepID=UPI0030CF057A